MPRCVGLSVAAALSVTAMGVLGLPAAAAVKADLTIVQGMPGKVVDVCLNGDEIKSGLAYGGKVSRSVNPGGHRLKLYARHRGDCQGTKLAGKVLELAPGADVTVVATAHSPKVVNFDNAGMDTLPPVAEGSLAVRHAADLGPVVMRFDFSNGFPFTPEADPEFEKGHEFKGFFVDSIYQQWATNQLTPADPIAGIVLHLRAGDRYEIALVGTTVSNARFVVIRKALVQ